jgi:hypothetical protein
VKQIVSVILALLVGSCAAQVPPPAPSPTFAEQAAVIPPTINASDAKKLILKNRTKLFKDPDSVRDAKIGPPFTCLNGSGNCICLEVNAKNSYGGYTGLQVLGVRLLSNDVEGIGEMAADAREKPCGPFSAFPELNGRAKR